MQNGSFPLHHTKRSRCAPPLLLVGGHCESRNVPLLGLSRAVWSVDNNACICEEQSAYALCQMHCTNPSLHNLLNVGLACAAQILVIPQSRPIEPPPPLSQLLQLFHTATVFLPLLTSCPSVPQKLGCACTILCQRKKGLFRGYSRLPLRLSPPPPSCKPQQTTPFLLHPQLGTARFTVHGSMCGNTMAIAHLGMFPQSFSGTTTLRTWWWLVLINGASKP